MRQSTRHVFFIASLASSVIALAGCDPAFQTAPALDAQGPLGGRGSPEAALAALTHGQRGEEWVQRSFSERDLRAIVDLDLGIGVHSRRVDDFLAEIAYQLGEWYDGRGFFSFTAKKGETEEGQRRATEVEIARWLNERPDAHDLPNVDRSVYSSPECTGTRCVPARERFPGVTLRPRELAAVFAELDAGRAPLCDGNEVDVNVCAVVRALIAERGGREWLVRGLAARAPSYTQRIVAMLGNEPAGSAVLEHTHALVEALVVHPVQWREALRTIAESFGCEASVPFARTAGKTWAALPDERGPILYLLARYTFHHCPDDPAIAEHGDRADRYFAPLGAPFDTTLLEEMLGASPGALATAIEMWPYLKDDTRTSRVDVIIRLLAGGVSACTGHVTCRQARRRADAMLGTLITQLHYLRDDKSLAELHRWLLVDGGQLGLPLGELVRRTAPAATPR